MLSPVRPCRAPAAPFLPRGREENPKKPPSHPVFWVPSSPVHPSRGGCGFEAGPGRRPHSVAKGWKMSKLLLCLRPSPLLGCVRSSRHQKGGEKVIFVKLGLRGSWCSVPITLGKGLKPAGSRARLLETQRLGLRGWDSCPPYAPKWHQTTPEHSLGFFFSRSGLNPGITELTPAAQLCTLCLSPNPRLIPLLCAPSCPFFWGSRKG